MLHDNRTLHAASARPGLLESNRLPRTIAQETFGGSEYVGSILSNSWLVTFHKGYGNVIRWRVEPLRPNTFVVT